MGVDEVEDEVVAEVPLPTTVQTEISQGIFTTTNVAPLLQEQDRVPALGPPILGQ